MTTKTGKILLGGLAIGTAVTTWILLPTNYPPHTLPPTGWGRANSDITQANIGQTICNPLWSTKTIRPSSSYTTALKVRQLKEMGYEDQKPDDYEEDHVLSLELGGAPSDPMNLWPQKYANPVGKLNLGAREKDQAENYLHDLVCDKSGIMPLQEAQDAIRSDWTLVWAKMKGYEVSPSKTDD